MGSAKYEDLPNLLCSLSAATLEHFFLLHTNPNRKKLKSPSERFENIFIEHWNDEEGAKDVFSRTRRDIRKRLQRYMRSFRSALSHPAVPMRCATTHRDDNSATDLLDKYVTTENASRGNALHTCRVKKSIKLRIIAKRGKKPGGGRQLRMERRDRTRLGRREANPKEEEEDSSDWSTDVTSFPLSDDTTASSHRGDRAWNKVPSKWYHLHCVVKKEQPDGGEARTPFSLTTNVPLDEVNISEERRNMATFRIDYEDDGEELSSAVQLGRRSHYGHALTGKVAKWTKWVQPRGSENGSYLGSKDNPWDSPQDNATESSLLPLLGSAKIDLKSVNYFLYKNLYSPIKEHYDNVNRILVWSFLFKHNLLAFVCLLKCAMFFETEGKHRVFSSLLGSKKGKSDGPNSGIFSSNNYDGDPSYDRHDGIDASTAVTTQSTGRRTKLLHHRVDSYCYTETDVCTKFAHIHVYIEIPHPLNFFFDESVVRCYTSVYRLTGLLYFTRQSLNGIFGSFRRFSKPLVYQYRRKDTDSGEGKIRKGDGHFRSSDFKFMDVINSIARGNASSGDSDEEQLNGTPVRNCLLSRNTCNAHLTGERFLSIGFDVHFTRHPSLHKFVSHVRILSELLKDLNQIRAEMDFLLGSIYDYIVNTHIVRSYFLFFNNVLKIGRFSTLIEFHKRLAEQLYHFSFLSSEFASLSRIICNIVNLVHVFKRIMDSLTWVDVEANEPVNFLQTFQEHTKQLERNIILLTCEEVQEFIRSFYANRNELILHVREFRSGPLECIYTRFFFNGFYARMVGEDHDD
ncbi:Uncharacterized protein PCOAH_00020950 [Plasmodium coatneyi]|uniref:Gamma tubulin complex component C-terminal domain-containing protein n=1 Tax=Plasmodium coatneyi TaxID=208452 RepID=A0A1B1DXZ6_9APIC|nr:Uncharacterized protein PCOAH_00020950 [Plasmodium coatneyi]ANQ07610.1 Uncharacterized protein PCOAH_00020950 [Plasmodium coatneyi]